MLTSKNNLRLLCHSFLIIFLFGFVTSSNLEAKTVSKDNSDKVEKKETRTVASNKSSLSKEDIEAKLSTLLPLLDPLTKKNIKSEEASFPYTIGKFKMNCSKWMTKDMGEGKPREWVPVVSKSEDEKDQLESQFGENGDVELTLELNKEVQNIADLSLVLVINDRFVVDRITSTDDGKFQVDAGGTTKECKQEFKANFGAPGGRTIFHKSDQTVCGDTTMVVKTEINKATVDKSKTTVKEGSYEIFVQHTNVDKSQKSSDKKLQDNVMVSCNFDPIKE